MVDKTLDLMASTHWAHIKKMFYKPSTCGNQERVLCQLLQFCHWLSEMWSNQIRKDLQFGYFSFKEHKYICLDCVISDVLCTIHLLILTNIFLFNWPIIGIWEGSVWPCRGLWQQQFFPMSFKHHSDIINGLNIDSLEGDSDWKRMAGWGFWQINPFSKFLGSAWGPHKIQKTVQSMNVKDNPSTLPVAHYQDQKPDRKEHPILKHPQCDPHIRNYLPSKSELPQEARMCSWYPTYLLWQWQHKMSLPTLIL